MLAHLHLAFIGVWLFLVLIETYIEFSALGNARRLQAAAQQHFWIDACLELPLVTGVLVTGLLLSRQVAVWTPLLSIKVALAMIAILDNYYCGYLVMRRYWSRHRTEGLAGQSKVIRRTWWGVPFGLSAIYLGLRYFYH